MPELADAGPYPIATLPQVPVQAVPAPVPASYDYAFLYPWQQEALKAWHSNARRGVVEAVTGSGKTRVGIAAAFEAVRQGFSASGWTPCAATFLPPGVVHSAMAALTRSTTSTSWWPSFIRRPTARRFEATKPD
jgi:hypothetical protein